MFAVLTSDFLSVVRSVLCVFFSWLFVRVHIGATWRIAYDSTVHVLRRCGLVSNYFDHLFLVVVSCC